MERITVNTSKSYEVVIGKGLTENIRELLPQSILKKGTAAVMVTDENVAPLYLEKVKKILESIGYRVFSHVVSAGEGAKSGESFLRLLSFLAENHVTRSDVIFALGGGVVGDLSGFAAAVYLRGVEFVQLPTTLLAAVDSSVGGKTAINLPEGKNLAGAFYQPAAVIMDTDMLDTLSEQVFADGFAEIIKYAVIMDKGLFELLEDSTVNEMRLDTELLIQVIARCVAIKRNIVSSDEHDKGLRNILNFGHTIGHSVEKNSGFTVSHGRAVAIGIVLAAKAAEKKGICLKGTSERLENLIKAYGLPHECQFSQEELYAGMLSDKKIEGGEINLILPKEIGNCYIHKLRTDELKEFLFGN